MGEARQYLEEGGHGSAYKSDGWAQGLRLQSIRCEVILPWSDVFKGSHGRDWGIPRCAQPSIAPARAAPLAPPTALLYTQSL